MSGDIGLVYNPSTGVCDIQFLNGDVALDGSARTPLIMAIGCDRRALPDDALPTGGVMPAGTVFNERRGTPLDALDPNGARMGSRLWLLEREKQSDVVLQAANHYLKEATACIPAMTGGAVTTSATYPQRNVMQYVASSSGATVRVNKASG